MFKEIRAINDIQPFVAHKKEIRFFRQPNGLTLGCYMFMDKETFDTPEALECRGIAFDGEGRIVSRPLHKFFNVGEKEWLMPASIAARSDVAAIYDKLDGSMIATAYADGQLFWRSKQSFESDVVRLAKEYLAQPQHKHIEAFAEEVAAGGMTVIFELTHPDARIIVDPVTPQLRLLHIRDNISGAYVLLDPQHPLHEKIRALDIPRVKTHGAAVSDIFSSLEKMRDMEGFVLQFANGDMAKVKCPWYARLHSAVSFLRERDIAWLALENRLDDVKSSLVELKIDLTKVEAVETRLKGILTALLDEVEAAYAEGKHLERKDFAVQYKSHPLFGFLMSRYTGKTVDLSEWYGRTRLRQDFGLQSLADGALADALEDA